MIKKNIFDNLIKDLNERLFHDYIIEIGVMEEDSGRDPVAKDAVTGKEVKQDPNGPTNAQLMFFHENGVPSRNIPSRPVLGLAIEMSENSLVKESKQKILKGVIYEGWDEEDVEREVKRLGHRTADIARNVIYDNKGPIERNAESTIEQKGYDHPLFRTSQLAKSITYNVIKKK